MGRVRRLDYAAGCTRENQEIDGRLHGRDPLHRIN